MSYVSEIADLFLQRCRRTKILSPAEFTAIVEWEKQEIPITVVQDSICEACDQTKGLQVNSIAEIHDKVKENFVSWLQMNEA